MGEITHNIRNNELHDGKIGMSNISLLDSISQIKLIRFISVCVFIPSS